MKVRIVKSRHDSYWYSDRIGREFDVREYSLGVYELIEDIGKLIEKRDCIIIEEEKEMKTNVKKLKEMMGKLTLAEAKEIGISAETYGKIVGEKEGLEWIPEDNYWYITNIGEVKWTFWDDDINGSIKLDKHNLKTGNIFKTKEIAEKKLADMNDEIQQKFVQIENYVRNNEEFECNWKDNDQEKYFIYYDYSKNKWGGMSDYKVRTNIFYMSKSMAEKVLKMLNGGE